MGNVRTLYLSEDEVRKRERAFDEAMASIMPEPEELADVEPVGVEDGNSEEDYSNYEDNTARTNAAGIVICVSVACAAFAILITAIWGCKRKHIRQSEK